MLKLALYAHLEAKPGKEAEVEAFLKSALPLAQKEPGTKTWYAFSEGPGHFGIFDTFEDEASRQAHLDGPIAAALMAKLRGAAEHSDPLSELSDQERVLLDLLGEGLTNKQIAARMFLAEKTVKNYVSRLLAKLGMERRTQAAVFISKLDQSQRHAEQ